MKYDQKPFKLKMTQKDSKWKMTKKIKMGDNQKIKMEDDQNTQARMAHASRLGQCFINNIKKKKIVSEVDTITFSLYIFFD